MIIVIRSLVFADCRLRGALGGTIRLDGTLTGRSTALGTCGLPPTSLSMVALDELEVVATNAQGMQILSATVDLSGALAAQVSLGSACLISGFDMTLTGTARSEADSSSVQLAFDQTHVVVAIDQYNADCVPLASRTTVDGRLGLSGDIVGGSFNGTFTNFIFADDITTGRDVVTLDGGIDSACFGGPASVDTQTALIILPSAVCPSEGSLLITAGTQTDRITYTATGVAIDAGNDGLVVDSYPTCFDPRLRSCPAG